MAFWSSAPSSEPRRNFKFILRVLGLPVWVVKTVTLPEITVNNAEHKFLNHTFYFPGTVTYNEISFTVVDSINEDISRNILRSFANTGYNTPESETAARSSLITKGAAVQSLGNITIQQLGNGESGTSSSIGFKLRNAWISKLTFPQGLDYSSEDLSDIQVSLKYDFFDFLRPGPPNEKVSGFGA